MYQAIGLRLAAKNEEEQRKKDKLAIEALIREKRAELDRHSNQLKSLEKIEAEQKVVIERATSSGGSAKQ